MLASSGLSATVEAVGVRQAQQLQVEAVEVEVGAVQWLGPVILLLLYRLR